MTDTVVPVNPLDDANAGSLEEQKIKEDSDDDAPAEVSSKMSSATDANAINDDASDDEEAAILAKAKAEESARRAASNKCDVCGENEKKYRCPKCDSRSCSLACSKKHKEDDNCDGVRGKWQPVTKVSRFNEQRVNEDANFLNQLITGVSGTLNGNQKEIQQAVNTQQQEGVAPTAASEGAEQEEEGALQVPAIPIPVIPDCLPEGLREQASGPSERFLIGACHKRRVFIYFNEEKGSDDASRHEQFSDTVFWAVTLEFREERKNEEGEGTGQFTSYSYTVQQVPESIHVRTVIKQFLRPRMHGPLVSKDELDMGRLQPFVDATAEKINIFMPAYLRAEEKFYTVNPEATFLDNLRQRVVVNHPKLIICLQSELPSMAVISEDEQRMVVEARRAILERRNAGGPRGGRGGAGGFRGNNFRGGPPGGFHHQGGRGGGAGGFGGFGGAGFGGGRGRGGGGGGGFRGGNKRPFEGGDRGGYGKRGRGDRGGGRGGGRPNYRNRDLDDFDPFEPFAGPGGAAMLESWNSSVTRTEPADNGGSGAKNYFPSLDALGSSPNKN